MFKRAVLLYFQFKNYFILSFLLLTSLILIFTNDNTNIKFVRSVAVGSIAMLQESFSLFPNFFSIQKENELLRQQNIELAHEVNQLREARLENIRLREILNIKDTTTINITSAKVVGRNLNILRNTITINKGSLNNVVVGNPIVTASGLVGRVLFVTDNYSVVQTLNNIDFKASVRLQRSRDEGIFTWNGKFHELTNVIKTSEVKSGDVVITSEFSDAFPNNIKVGLVKNVSDVPGKLFKKIEIAPFVSFSILEEVFILDYLPEIEKISIANLQQ
ncbi:MAG: rod shape-determining protein MreC [Bacteroidetes bacterium]|nr:rod shape-determining protein MreC [Bacteroidota bacterium]